jgi:L-lactate dehydrogenase complex protein LldE
MNVQRRRVTLFVTCIVDQIYPNVGMAAADLLLAQGLDVDVPAGLTCCGQMAYNSGFREDAAAVAARTLDLLRGSSPIVMPSGSCAAMLRHSYAELFDGTRYAALAAATAARTFELSEFLVDELGVTDVGARFNGRLTYHDACHGLRWLDLGPQARTLLAHVAEAETVPLDGCDQCCGFGGLFAVKHAPISAAMLDRKLAAIEAAAADVVVTADVSCMTQIAGGLSRRGSAIRARHLAEVLANRVDQR